MIDVCINAISQYPLLGPESKILKSKSLKFRHFIMQAMWTRALQSISSNTLFFGEYLENLE